MPNGSRLPKRTTARLVGDDSPPAKLERHRRWGATWNGTNTTATTKGLVQPLCLLTQGNPPLSDCEVRQHAAKIQGTHLAVLPVPFLTQMGPLPDSVFHHEESHPWHVIAPV